MIFAEIFISPEYRLKPPLEMPKIGLQPTADCDVEMVTGADLSLVLVISQKYETINLFAFVH